MIAYFKDRNVSVEVPDDFTDQELADVQQNWDQHFVPEKAPLTPSNGITFTPEENLAREKEFGSITAAPEYKRDFFQSVIHPITTALTAGPVAGAAEAVAGSAMEHPKAIAEELGLVDIPLVQNRTPMAHAFVGKAIEHGTFGLSKPITDIFDEAYKQHPVASAGGSLVGGVGSLMSSGALIEMTALPGMARVAAAGTAELAAAGPRFAYPALMNAATFGTNTFINKTVESMQKGRVDLEDFGKSVLFDTTLGGAIGAIGAFRNAATTVFSAAGLGFLSAKAEGADNMNAGLSAATWALFETVMLHGKEERMRKEAISTLYDTVHDFVKKAGPQGENALHPGVNAATAENLVNGILKKGGGYDSVVASKENTLRAIEELNQLIRLKTKTMKPGAAVRPEYTAYEKPEKPVSIKIEGPVEQVGTNLPAEVLSGKVRVDEQYLQAIEQFGGPEGQQIAVGLRTKYAEQDAIASTPDLASVPDAVSYGKSVAGDQVRMTALEQKATDMENQAEGVAIEDPQASQRLMVGADYLRKALLVAQNPTAYPEPGAPEPPPAPAPENQPLYDRVFQDLKTKYGNPNNYTTPSGVTIKISRDVIGAQGFKEYQRGENEQNVIWVDTIESKEKGKGNASAALKEITDSADQHGVTVNLWPRIFKKEKGQLPFKQLIKWYEGHGFVKNPDGSMTRAPQGFQTAKKTQAETVKESVKETPKSIKEVAAETGILEPNIRRIFGVGAKDGTFVRVEEGVYVLNVGDENVAYVMAADAIEALPRLAERGFKANMVFLDIPYNTAAVKGGNRGVKYALVSVNQFKTVLDAISKILVDENSPVYYMYSQAPSGLRQMLAYNDALAQAGFKPIAEGEYTKTQLDGVTQVRNMRGEVILPEKIVLLNKSGNFIEKEANRNLNFKLIRPKGYQTQKPLEILDSLIMQGTEPGDMVLDPFAGSGTTTVAAIKKKRSSMAIEINPDVVQTIIIPRAQRAAAESRADKAEMAPEDMADMAAGGDMGRTKKGGRAEYTLEDQKAAIKRSFGGMEYVQKMAMPELVKIVEALTGTRPYVEKMAERLAGFFRPSTGKVHLNVAMFKDTVFMEAVLAHEIGHLWDFLPDKIKSMPRGNILGRLASELNYRQKFLPEYPGAPGLLTEADKARLKKEAQQLAKEAKTGEASPEAKIDNAFDPQAILNVWNSATQDVEIALVDFIKRLSTAEKKAIIKQAMTALSKGEQLQIEGVRKFNKDANKDSKKVADIYKDLIQKEIKKRALWSLEVIEQELKDLSMWWKPFTEAEDPAYTKYRYEPWELYADLVSVLLNAPKQAFLRAPHAYEAFWNYIEKKPDVVKALLELQTMIQGPNADLQIQRLDDLIAMTVRGEDVSQQIAAFQEESNLGVLDTLRIVFWRRTAMVQDEIETLKEKGLFDPATDGRKMIEQMSSAYMSSFIKSHLEDFDRLSFTPASKEKNVDFIDSSGAVHSYPLLTLVKVKTYLDRIASGDRSEMANPLGMTKEASQELLDFIKKDHPNEYARIQKYVESGRQWLYDLHKIPGASDFYTPAQLAIMDQNHYYAPYLVIQYFTGNVDPEIEHQLGTFLDVKDPYTGMVAKGAAMLSAIQRNKLMKLLMNDTILKSAIPHSPAIVDPQTGVIQPPKKGLGIIKWRENGETVAVYVPRHISDSLSTVPMQGILTTARVLRFLLLSDVFRALYTTFSLSFTPINAIKDFFRTYKTLHMIDPKKFTLRDVLERYIAALPIAKDRAKDIYNPIIQQIERAGGMRISLNNLVLSGNNEDAELARIFRRFTINKDDELLWEDVPIVNTLVHFLDLIKTGSDIVESTSKIVGWQALDALPDAVRADIVRNLIGTPGVGYGGIAAPITNEVLLFSEVFKESLVGIYKTGLTGDVPLLPGAKARTKKERTKAKMDYWTTTFFVNFIPKIWAALASAGLLGVGGAALQNKKLFDSIPDYYKANGACIPLGVDTQTNDVIFLWVPADEEGRLFGAIFWSLINGTMGGRSLVDNLQNIMSFGAEQFPGPAPGGFLYYNLYKYASGGETFDPHTGRPILTDRQRLAGGVYGVEPMLKWVLNQSGQTRLSVQDRFSTAPMYKTIIQSTPGIQRFIRIGQRGMSEKAQLAGNVVAKEEARVGEQMSVDARKAIRKAEQTPEGLAKALYDFKSQSQSAEEMTKREEVFNQQLASGDANMFGKTIRNAGSNAQRVAMLKSIRSDFLTAADFIDYGKTLVDRGDMSLDVLNDVLRES